jgi:hypothetical protein
MRSILMADVTGNKESDATPTAEKFCPAQEGAARSAGSRQHIRICGLASFCQQRGTFIACSKAIFIWLRKQ